MALELVETVIWAAVAAYAVWCTHSIASRGFGKRDELFGQVARLSKQMADISSDEEKIKRLAHDVERLKLGTLGGKR